MNKWVALRYISTSFGCGQLLSAKIILVLVILLTDRVHRPVGFGVVESLGLNPWGYLLIGRKEETPRSMTKDLEHVNYRFYQ